MFRKRFLTAVIVVLVLGFGGCHRGGGDARSPSTAAPSASTASTATPVPATPQPFAIAGTNASMYQGQLALVLTFTQPIVGTQAFDTLLEVKEKDGGTITGSWALDEDARTLRFPYAQPERHYVVRVKGTLVAASGATLGSDQSLAIYGGPLAPAVGFASQGNVLPARRTRGLPVVSVNVKDVDVEFLRVRDDELPNFFAAYQKNGRRSSWDLDPNGEWYGRKGKPVAQIADSVYAGRFSLDGKPDQRSVDYLPVQNIHELSKPGLYFAVMTRAGSFNDERDTAFFFVSDIGLHLRVYHDALFVHAASLLTGAPLSGVDLRVLDGKGEAAATGKTDGDGNATIAHAFSPDQVLVAHSGSDVSMLAFNQPALDLSEFAVAGRRQTSFDVFAWSGRDLYRPGETVRLAALLRDDDGKPMPPQPLFLTLKQPDGRAFAEAKLDPRALGYFEWSYPVPADAPTGRWQVEFRTDPNAKEASRSLAVRIEEFLPERLKLDLDSAQATLAPGEALKLAVDGAYLYGAPAADNRFTARLTLEPDLHPIAKLPDYAFGDPAVALPKQAKDVADTKLDDHGKLALDVPLDDAAKAGAPVAAFVTGSVYETGGRAVTRTLKRTIWPAKVLIGIRPLFDPADGADAHADARFEVVASDAGGDLLAARNLVATLVRERRDYHWSRSDNAGWTFDYTSHYENVSSQTFDVAQGQSAKLALPVDWGDYRLEVRNPATGLTTRFPFVAGWSWNDDNRGKDARPDKVKLALDKPAYRAGDTLKVTLTPPHDGPGLLLVESNRLLYVRDIEARAGATFDIPVTKDWERHDVYVTALVFRGGSAADRITPSRAVGEAYVPIDRADRKVAVKITAPDKMEPLADLVATVSVPALAGQPADVTVSAVDVGILNITRYPLPDPNGWFFAQRALGVDAYDVYGRVIESFEGGNAKLRFGGDMALATLPQARRPTAHVQTVDLWSGVVALDARGDAKVALKVPDFNGTVRVTAVVFAADRYGSADTETIVRAPLVVEASAPRVLAPGDHTSLTVDLRNYTGTASRFDVEASAGAPLTLANGRRRVELAANGKTTLAFPLGAKEGYGTGTVHIRARSIPPANRDIRVDRSLAIPVRAGWPAVARSSARSLDTRAPVTFDSHALDGLLPESVTARMTVSHLPPLPFAAALTGLLDYPYGCLEQTVSKGYAALVLDAETASRLHVAGLDAKARAARVDSALGRIGSMQIPTGLFSMWGGDDDAATFLSPYAVEFMEDARDAGFAVPDAVLQKALQRLNDDLLSGGHPYYGYEHADHMRFADEAYSGYVLARVNRAPLGTLRALFDNDRDKSLTPLPLVHLGVALKLMGDSGRAEKAIAEAFTKKFQRPWYLGDYGSDLRDGALMVALVHRYGLDQPGYDARLFDLARSLASARSQAGDRQRGTGVRTIFLSTQEQAAIARLGKQLLTSGDETVSGTLTIGGHASLVTPDRLWSRTFDAAELAAGVKFTPDGALPLYVATDVAGVPTAAPAADGRKVSIRRAYFTLDGEPWSGAPLAEGDGLIAAITLEARDEMPDALLTDLLPGGLELENFNLTDAKQWAGVVIDGITLSERAQAAEVKHEEFRDDRYVAALSLHKGQAAHVFYLLRAVSPGRYAMPPTLVEDMYRPELRGVGASTPAEVTVVEPR